MYNKRGQFYFIAAIIMILILAGFIAVSNFSKKTENNEIKDLKKELGIEIQKTLEHISYNNLNHQEAKDVFKNLSAAYIYKIKDNKNILFLFGKLEEDLTLKGYKAKNSNNFTITSGTNEFEINSEGEFEETINNPESTIIVETGGNLYLFELLEGQSFYYLISKEYKGEVEIIKG